MNTILRILRLGLPESKDHLLTRRLLLLNLFYIVTTLTIIASLIESFYANEPRQMQYVLVSVLFLLVLVPVLARINSYVSGTYFMLLANGIAFFFSNVQGINSGTYLFFFPMFFACAWLMDFRKPAYNVLLLGMTVLTVVLVVVFPDSLFGFKTTPEQQHTSFVFALITSSCIMGINTLVIVWMNYRRHNILENEIAEKEKASRGLSEALKEKEILIAEIHHRVKNNLAVVRGLLNMQMHTSTNEAARETLRESVNRVTAMALIHQKLYSSRNAESVDLQKYVSELVTEVTASYQDTGTAIPKVQINVRDTILDLNHAVPCGLILNELLTNAFKHAFSNGKQGIINIEIAPDAKKSGFIDLVVKDNGNGIPQDFDPETIDSLGMTIIRSLSEQIDGTFTFTGVPGQGTRAQVNFPAATRHRKSASVN